ncbi:transcriptional regulator BetI [Pararhizobium polonicum]|uniref:transcriptional regulator BetI n=1 Tax=Pararhizobium polonicum TaxID=1612624 RepID=UPI000839F6F3|nr:transcriptional regulator BetI [Pararhizobium polonicum]
MSAQPKKQKKRIEEIRRIELIEAAYRIFIRDGLKGLTTTRICHEAGMSQGILTYYFKDKEEVLFEMVRHANRILMDEVVMRLRAARTRWDRILAVVDGNFPESRFERNTANAWISFYAEAAHNERYARLQRLFYRRLRSNLAAELAPVLEREEIAPFVLGFAAMLDGIWLRRGHSDADISLLQAKQLLVQYTRNSLGETAVKRLQMLPSGE